LGKKLKDQKLKIKVVELPFSLIIDKGLLIIGEPLH